MALKGSRRFIVIIVGLFFLAGILFLFFNEYGVLKFIKLNKQVNELNEQILKVENENRRLQAEIDSLENKVPAKIEKVAREKYNMMRPGESKVVVEEK